MTSLRILGIFVATLPRSLRMPINVESAFSINQP
jgi:hypothetical protein